MRNDMTRLKKPGARSPSLKLEPHTAFRTKIRPNSVAPFAAAVNLRALRSPKTSIHTLQMEPRAPRGFSGRFGIKRAYSGNTPIARRATMSPKTGRSTQSFSVGEDTVEVPTSDTRGSLSKAKKTAQLPNAAPAQFTKCMFSLSGSTDIPLRCCAEARPKLTCNFETIFWDPSDAHP